MHRLRRFALFAVLALAACSPAPQPPADDGAGTMYIYDADGIHAYADVGAVGGNLAPDRSFTLAGITDEVYDMAMNPDADVAFLSISATAGDRVVRVSGISTRTGVVSDFVAFDALGRAWPSSLAYDAATDELYVWFEGALHVYEDASTAPADSAPARVLAGANLGAFGARFDGRIVLDTVGDRLFLSRSAAQVAVYDDASTLDGNIAPDRIVTITTPNPNGWYIWGLAYDVARDLLYVASQNMERAIFVIDDASTADGSVAAARTIGGPINPLYEPSMIEYDDARDRLFVVRTEKFFEGFSMYLDASTVNGDVPADLVVTGANVPVSYPYGGYFDPTE